MQAELECEKRLSELAGRAAETGIPQVTWFLSPAEQTQAERCAVKAGMSLFRWGVEDMERRIVAFADTDWEAEWSVACVQIAWDGRYGSPGHRDLLGAMLALGISRDKIGDIFPGDGEAHVFMTPDMARYIAANLQRAGKVPVRVQVMEQIPSVASTQGTEIRATVASLRLDAVLGAVWRLPRARAAAFVKSGYVQVNHLIETRPDKQLAEGSTLSARGLGRAKIVEIGGKTKKDRVYLTLLRY